MTQYGQGNASTTRTDAEGPNLSTNGDEAQLLSRKPVFSKEMFGVPYAFPETTSSINAGDAKQFVKDNRDHIMAMAKVYRIDEMVLANVVYQERRHSGPDDWAQDRLSNKHDTGNLGPSQMSIDVLIGLIDRGKVHLTQAERADYASDKRQFGFEFLVDEKNGIRAAAALINDRLQTLEKKGLIPDIPRDQDPRSLSLGQFVYGAALYSNAGRTGNSDFDRLGPTSEQIDFKKNNIASVQTLPHSEKLIFSFHYLHDTYSALYGVEGPKTLGGYFHDRSILRDTRQSSFDASPQDRTASTTGVGNSDTFAGTNVAASFGDKGQASRDTFDSIATRLPTVAPNLSEQQIAVLSADLTSKSLSAGHQNPTLAANEQGRVFAYDPNKPHAQPVYSDPQTLNPETVVQNATKARELTQTQIATVAMDNSDPQRTLDAKQRSIG
jgi:hypothetical protein